MVNNLPAMQETQVYSLDQEDPLEKGMTTHSSIIAWEIPRTEEPGRLHSSRGRKGSDTTEWLTLSFTLFFRAERKYWREKLKGQFLFWWHNIRVWFFFFSICMKNYVFHFTSQHPGNWDWTKRTNIMLDTVTTSYMSECTITCTSISCRVTKNNNSFITQHTWYKRQLQISFNLHISWYLLFSSYFDGNV